MDPSTQVRGAALAAAKVNLRGMSAGAIGRKFVCYLAVDTAAQATKAAATLRKL